MKSETYATRRFNPSRGGHAPGHLSHALYRWLEDGSLGAAFICDDEPYDIRVLTGALWNCGDVLPSYVSSPFEDPQPVTVAQAVRRIRALEYRVHRPPFSPVR